MSSGAERLSRWGPLALFGLLTAGSALLYQGITPLWGAPQTPKPLVEAVDRGVALLARAKRPYVGAALCQPLQGWLPNLIPPGQGDLEHEPPRRVILCAVNAGDRPLAMQRAQRDGLTWARTISGTDLLVMATDEAAFRQVMTAAGALVPEDLLPLNTQAEALHAGAPDIRKVETGWSLPAHAGERLLLFGPYLPLSPGDYAVRLHGRFEGAPVECAAAVAALRPSLSVTADAGKVTLVGKAPSAVAASPTDPCAFSVSSRFTVGAAGAQNVETPFYAGLTRPALIDDYALAPVAPAQSR